MSTAIEDTRIREALTKLQDSPRQPNESVRVWADHHREDMVLLMHAKGVVISAELLGFTPAALHSWISSRQIPRTFPRVSRDGQQRLTPNQIHPPFTPGGPSHARVEPVAPAAHESEDYIRGQRDAYREILARLTTPKEAP